MDFRKYSDKYNEMFYDSMYKDAHKNMWCDPTICPECLKESSICDSNFILEDVCIDQSESKTEERKQ